MSDAADSHYEATEQLIEPRIGLIKVGGHVLDAHGIGGRARLTTPFHRHQARAWDAILANYELFAGCGSIYERREAVFSIMQIDELRHDTALTKLTKSWSHRGPKTTFSRRLCRL